MKKNLLFAGAVILLAIAGRAFWVYQQVKSNKQQETSPLVVIQNTNLTPIATTTAVAQEEEGMMTGGNNAGPDCQYAGDTEVSACRDLNIEYKTELSNSIKDSMYIVSATTNGDQNGWYNSYSVVQMFPDAHFLGIADSLITKEFYNKIFVNNVINNKKFGQNFSVHCSDDKTILPTINSRHCYGADQPENSYLFNDNGERLIKESDFKGNFIGKYNGYPDKVGLLETIKKLKTTTALIIDQDHVYVPRSNPLQKVEVIYSGYIDGNKLMPKDKIEEISYFKDGSSTTIK